MTTSPTSNGAEALMAIKNISSSTENASQDVSSGVGKVLGKLTGSDFEYWIRKDKVVIGRNSSHGKVDVNIGYSSYVSRKHLQINYERSRFFLVCIGKNGVFVDGQFQRLGANPMPLDKACVIRFPSTSIRLTFSPLPPEMTYINGSSNQKITTDVPTNQQQTELKPVTYSTLPAPRAQRKSLSPVINADIGSKENCELSSHPLKYTIPRDPRGFLSAPPSPTGTISAVNSCPSSPRGGTSHFINQNHSVTDNLNAAVSVITASVIDEQNEKSVNTDGVDSKPPYSYAQLIIQAISTAAHRQLTLSGIYAHITKNYPYYRTADKGWQNSIRHNLSLNRYFVKVPRSQEESGKGSFWRVDPASERKLVEQAWRKRRQRAVPCFCAPLTAGVSTITRSAPVSPEHSNPISPISASHGGLSSSQEEPQHPVHNFENDSKLQLVQLTSRYAQSAPGSPSGHGVSITGASDGSLIPSSTLAQHRAAMTSAGTIPISDNSRNKVIWPVQPMNAPSSQGIQPHYSTPSAIKEDVTNGVVLSNTSTAAYHSPVSMESPKVSIVMQPPISGAANPTTIATFTAQQHQQLFQQQQKFQQQVVMVAGQNNQRVQQAIPLNIGTLVAASNTIVNTGLPFVVPGNQQYVVKRINESSGGETPQKKMKTEGDSSSNEPPSKTSD